MKFVPNIFFLALLCIPAISKAQDLGKDFIEKNLKQTSYQIDPDAEAVVLYENHFTFIQDEKGVLKQTVYVHKIVKILKDEALGQANIHIFFPHDDDKNYVDHIRAITYNLSGNTIDSAVIKDEDLLKKGIIKKNYELSFSLPYVRVGSIIDYSYQQVSDREQSLYTWKIQEKYPKLMTEYGILFPETHQFAVKPYTRIAQVPCKSVKEARTNDEPFCITKDMKGDPKITWIRKNVPGIKKEPYVVNSANHIEKMELTLTGRNSSYSNSRFIYYRSATYVKTWEDLNQALWTKDLRKTINDPNIFLKAVVDSLTKSANTEDDKIAAIFKYVRTNIKYRKNGAYATDDLERIFVEKSGGIAETNTLLVAMLVKAGINASPLAITTTSNVSQVPEIVIISNLNYLAAAVKRDSSYILLDASDTNNTVGSLPLHCYNGYAWVLADNGTGIYLTPDMITDKRVNIIKLYDFTDSGASVDIAWKYGTYSSARKRRELKYKKEKQEREKEGEEEEGEEKNTKDEDEILNDLPDNITLLSTSVEGENNPDAPLIVKYKCRMKIDRNIDNLFIKGSLIGIFDENPLKSTQRQMPIEFTSKQDLGYYLTIIMPENVSSDTLGPPVHLDFYNDGIMYKKTAQYIPEARTLTVNCNFKINQTNFEVTDYESLRSFFEKVMEYNKEVIVLKKTTK